MTSSTQVVLYQYIMSIYPIVWSSCLFHISIYIALSLSLDRSLTLSFVLSLYLSHSVSASLTSYCSPSLDVHTVMYVACIDHVESQSAPLDPDGPSICGALLETRPRTDPEDTEGIM
jgi:hypothetical protein